MSSSTDPKAGLYCRSRKSELMKILIPEENIGFQIGETAQVHSGGYLQVRKTCSPFTHTSHQTLTLHIFNSPPPSVSPLSIQ
ncbi:hypothetical protein EON65_48880, partial [archaeon]